MIKTLMHRHPFDLPPAGSAPSGIAAIRAVDHLDIVRQAALVAVMAGEGDLSGIRHAVAGAGLRRIGPGEWLAVARDTFPDMLAASLASALPATAFVCDQSDGHVLINLRGPNVRRILAKGVAIDLHSSVFSTGMSATLLCGHIVVTIARTGENEFELIVSRSLAQSLLDALVVMGREFDLSVGLWG